MIKEESMSAKELTCKQKQVLSTLKNYWIEHKVPPSIADLAKKLGVNKATAYEHLLALKKKGYLIHQERAGRTWRPSQDISSCSHKLIPLLSKLNKSMELLSSLNITGHIIADYEDISNIVALKIIDDRFIDNNIDKDDIIIINTKANVLPDDLVIISKDNNEIDIIYSYQENKSNNEILGKIIEIRRML